MPNAWFCSGTCVSLENFNRINMNVIFFVLDSRLLLSFSIQQALQSVIILVWRWRSHKIPTNGHAIRIFILRFVMSEGEKCQEIVADAAWFSIFVGQSICSFDRTPCWVSYKISILNHIGFFFLVCRSKCTGNILSSRRWLISNGQLSHAKWMQWMQIYMRR